METPTFEALGLSKPLLDAIKGLGFEAPTPIQAKTIPVAVTGKDIVGLSQTGSGKTAAFVVPSLESIDLSLKQPQLLIMCPTRELCVQVCEEVHSLGSKMRTLVAVPVYGGTPIDRQIKTLKKGAQVVVGTPGRILDHLKRKTLKMDAIQIVVLDEADRMLDMGFRDDMDEILTTTPEDRQTLFFSATMNKGVERLIEHFGQDPVRINIERKTLTVASIEQTYFEVRNRSKVEVLSRLLDMEPPRLGIIFCNTKRAVDECNDALAARGYAADRLHGDITQANRERVLKKFRSGEVELLIATDVAARGLDIDEVDAVFNYDIPQDPEDYVHRIGRTGRAGRSGRAISFIYGRDIYRLQSIERYIKSRIRRLPIPTQEEVEGRRSDLIFNSVREVLEKQEFQPYVGNVDRLLDQGYTPTDISAALFSMLKDAFGREPEEIIEDKEPNKPFTPRERDGRGERRGGRRGGRERDRDRNRRRKGGDTKGARDGNKPFSGPNEVGDGESKPKPRREKKAPFKSSKKKRDSKKKPKKRKAE